MEEQTRPPIDLEHLAQYTAGDMALEAEVLNMFLGSAAGYIDTMDADGTPDGWPAAAHGLKGVARGVGAAEIADLAETAENLPPSAADERACQVARLRRALARVQEFVETRHGG